MKRLRERALAALACAVASAQAWAAQAPTTPLPAGPLPAAADFQPQQAFANHRDPPAWAALPADLAGQYELGHEVFNTSFVPAGTPGGGRRAGVGPLYNGGSCDECHNEGARGRGPTADGPAPDTLVVQLQGGTQPADDPVGDPVYGRVFNVAAVAGFKPEGQVIIHYRSVRHAYPDGSVVELRQPRYELADLRYGPLAQDTIIKPRLAPAVFGDGLLELAQAPDAPRGRFGWSAGALSVADQTTRALSREMGLSNADRAADDCTPAEADCRGQTRTSPPEVSAELLRAVLVFQQYLAVPRSPVAAVPGSDGQRLFNSTGCAGCHAPRLAVNLPQGAGSRPRKAFIAPYTDLKLHDMGPGLADWDVAQLPHNTPWRTAPLWGLGYELVRSHQQPTLLHDGRARSTEEAILWHDGEAAAARKRFENLPRAQRQALLDFLATL